MLNKLKDFFTTKQGIFVVSIATIIGTFFGILLGIVPFFGSSHDVVPEKVVQTILANHEQQLTEQKQQLLSKEELNQQLVEIVQVLL